MNKTGCQRTATILAPPQRRVCTPNKCVLQYSEHAAVTLNYTRASISYIGQPPPPKKFSRLDTHHPRSDQHQRQTVNYHREPHARNTPALLQRSPGHQKRRQNTLSRSTHTHSTVLLAALAFEQPCTTTTEQHRAINYPVNTVLHAR